ncbi:MAG TPA: hypothetical protein VK249_27345 [Anaerolineales bacterium]|nr:hypothetical protein [Anaerolineales bacterium]
MNRWIVPAIVLCTTACLAQPGVTAPPTGEIPGVESATTPFSIPGCQPAAGVTFRLQKISTYLAEVIASGLQPGETPYVYYDTVEHIANGGTGFPGEIVGADGEFYSDLNWRLWDVDILKPPEGEPSATWEFRLVHARGVECARITLP